MGLEYIPTATGGTGYADPFVGRPGPAANLLVDISTLRFSGGTGEVDAAGYLKPGVCLTAAGATCNGTAAAFGVVPEATKLNLATIPPTDASLAAITTDQFVGVFTSGLINRDIAKDNLGRSYTAEEINSLGATAGSRFTLTST